LAIPHAMERSFATPMIRPRFPAINCDAALIRSPPIEQVLSVAASYTNILVRQDFGIIARAQPFPV
jgi:hypothetical protein